eukprot:TRINITY_DN19083_c0_g1_i1.p1 TRINITY_DN19083_c0_g1~~TRINITY_DN19083_c0_g1_i1.p1  ORF type:complete len:121 (+),score=21.34 TRINITY_DN19083_c0_g1_i1:34-396(+)
MQGEKQLMKDLHTTYNIPYTEGDAVPATPTASVSIGRKGIRERVTEFFKQHNPAKLPDVNAILAAYVGRDDQLIRDLYASYNVPLLGSVPTATPAPATPPQRKGFRVRVVAFFKKLVDFD